MTSKYVSRGFENELKKLDNMIALDKNLSDYTFEYKIENNVRYYSHPHFYYDSPHLHLIERKSKKKEVRKYIFHK